MENIKVNDKESSFFNCEWKIYINDRYEKSWFLWIKYISSNYVKVEVDVESFKVLSKNYAKDKNKVYRFAEKEEKIYVINNWSDLKTFENIDFENIDFEKFFKDKNFIYYNGYKKEFIDKNSFQILSLYFSKDKNKVYLSHSNILKILEWVDSETFELFYWNIFQKDKNFVYFYGSRNDISDKIDRYTLKPYEIKYNQTSWFEVPKDKLYFSDKNHTYIVFDSYNLNDVDIKIVWLNYKHIWNNYYSDNENVYFKYKILPELSVKSTLEDIKTYHYKKQIFSYHYLFKNKGLEFEEKIKKSKITALKEQKFWRDNFYIFYKFDEKNPDKKIISYDLSDFFDFDYNWKFEDIKFIDDFSFIAWENLYYKWKKIWKILKYLLKKSNLRLIYFADDNFYLIDEKDIYFKWNKKLEFVNNYYHNYWIFLVLNWKYVYYKWEKIFTYEKQKKLNDYYFKYFWVIKYENISEHFFRYEEKWKVFVLTEFNNWNKYNISEYTHENPNHLTDYSIEEYIKMKNYNLKQQKN